MARLTIGRKILIGFLVGAVVPIFLLEFLDVVSARSELEQQRIEGLDAIADLKQQQIEKFFHDMVHEADLQADLGFTGEALPVLSELYADRDNEAYHEARHHLDEHLVPTRHHKNLLEIILADTEGRMVYNTGAVHNDSELGLSTEMLVAKDQFADGSKFYISDVFESPFAPSGFELVTAAPVYRESDDVYVGMVILAIDMGPVFDLILNRTGLGETGETLLGRNEGDHALFLHPLRHDEDAALKRKVSYNSTEALPIREATQGNSGSGVTTDYRSEEIIASWRPLTFLTDDLTWGMVAKIDTSEAFAASRSLLYQAVAIGCAAVVFLLVAGVYLGRSIARPLKELQKAVARIAKGDLDVRVAYKGKNEIGDLGASFNNMAEQLIQAQSHLAEKTQALEQSVVALEQTNSQVRRSRRASFNILKDVKEEKERTAREKERMATILRSIGDGVFVVDTNEVIQIINPVAAELAGTTVEEALGQPYKRVLDFKYEEDGTVNDRFIVDAIRTGEIQEMSNHTVLVRPDGAQIPVADSAAPITDSQGTIRGCVVVFRDVSKEHAIDKAKTEFVSLASHQLRTPLAAINWNAEALRDDVGKKLTPDQRQYLDDLHASSIRMSELVTALLNVSRIELGTFAVDPEDVDVMALTRDVVKELEPRITEKQLKLTEHYEPEKLVLQADPKLLRMVIENLLTNAVKYTPEQKSIAVTIRQEGEQVVMEFRDEGYGIPKGQQAKIFTRLFRADNVRDKDVEGTGLGLYIVKSIVEHSGGTIRFESEEEKGTTFFVTLPLTGMSKKEGTRQLS